jgi:hypothetical protein
MRLRKISKHFVIDLDTKEWYTIKEGCFCGCRYCELRSYCREAQKTNQSNIPKIWEKPKNVKLDHVVGNVDGWICSNIIGNHMYLSKEGLN